MADDTNAFVQWRHAPPGQWRFCPLCGTHLAGRTWDGKIRRYCSHCGFVYWERPLPAAAAIVVAAHQPDQVVLVKRRYPPEVGEWTLPGGGIEAGESVESAAVREVHEETGLVIAIDAQLGTWSTPTNETIITFFIAHQKSGRLIGGSDALDAQWFAAGTAPRLAFSTHRDALQRFCTLNGIRRIDSSEL